jgi:glutathione synthase/RimK-type ligase-like ATP-grasp enzyme
MSVKVAFLRSPNVEDTLHKTGFWDEVEVLAPHFAKLGAKLVSANWHDSHVDWSDFDFVIPKCCWDYFNHYEEFLRWLDTLEKNNVRFKNALPLIRWNSNKHYLEEMADKGASVAPLRLISDETQVDSLQREFGLHPKILLKPAVSGGGKQTLVYQAAELEKCKADAREILRDCDVVVQPYLSEVADGEWSFFFFGGAFSHAIKKVPHKGDFRAHSLFGAHNSAMSPSAAQIDEARQILSYLPEPAHYARVDGIYVKGKLMLIELELIEPYLYLEHASPDAPVKFAQALMD